ncbi:MAG: hypothetical protein GX102_02155 [Porphyromonadaceae bacterium]|nr:hypothetical protein [Porphyromonadaceae bacterium]
MKIINLIKVVFLIAVVTLASCKDYVDIEKTSPEIQAGNQGVFFPESNQSAFELEPTEPTQIQLTIARSVSAGAVEIPITVDVNENDVFQVPATVSFADGETEKEITINFPTAGEGVTYPLRISVYGDQYVNPYSDGVPYVEATVTRIKWVPVDEPMVYVDGPFVNVWLQAPYAMYVNAEKAELGDVVRYRFKNMFKPRTAPADEDGINNGFVNQDPGFHGDKDWYTIIEIADSAGMEGEVFMFARETGVEWGSYGMISIGSIYRNFLDRKKEDFPLGTLKDSVITFPPKSLYFRDKDGVIPSSAPAYIYMSKEHFIAANKKITDFNKVEYEDILGAVSEYHSAAYSDSWNAIIAKAIDIDLENEKSDYKNLYYLSNLYADDNGLAFYYADGGRVRIPDNQPIGKKIFGKDIYVSQSDSIESSVEVNDKGVTVYTLGLLFHYEDGTVLGHFAEKFFYSEDPVAYDKADFIGKFKMTGLSQLGEDDLDKEVNIAEGAHPDTLIITGIPYAEEVKAAFDETTSTMSIASQALADIVANGETYDMSLINTDEDGMNSEAIMEFTFNMEGKLVMSSTSTSDGYVIRSVAAGGFVSGFYNIVFTKVTSTPAPISSRIMSNTKIKLQSSKRIVKKTQVKAGTHNFKIQGKKSPVNMKKNVSTNFIF